MKKTIPIPLFLFSSVFIAHVFSQNFTFVGAEKCKMCHKSEKQGQQYLLWEARKHSKSFAALATDEAKALAADAPENPKCLKCHAPLFEKAPDLKAEGVTCEVCHGPGSEYKKMNIMKDHTEAVKNGLIEYASPEAIKTQCLTCHANAHDKPFDFAAAWEKVKHPVPGKE